MAGNRFTSKLSSAALLSGLMLLSVDVLAEFPNPGRYGGFVPPHELERLQNLDRSPDASDTKQEFDPYFSVENDPWQALPSPFEPADIKSKREEVRAEMEQMRSKANRFISERELQMLENPPMMQMRFGGPSEPHNVWGDLNAADNAPVDVVQNPPAMGNKNYPYGGYAPQTPQWQSVVPGFSPGYMPAYGGAQQRGFYSSPYMSPPTPSPYMMNSIAPFLY